MDYIKYSVALCTYNGEKYVSQQLESIINQSIKPAEIIVSDDGSTDQTLDIVKRILDNSGIEYQVLSNTGVHGVTHNFQNAISHCSSPVVFTSDQDDVWLADKAKLMLEVFMSNPKAQLVFSDGELVDENLNLLNSSVWNSVGVTREKLDSNNWFHYLLKNCLITGAAMAFKKNLFDTIGVIPKEWLHDGWLAWCAVAVDGLVPCEHRLFYYRQHSGNVVGMIPSNSYFGKVRGYLHNFGEIQQNRRIRYYRYKSLREYLGNRFTDKQIAEMDKCIGFWEKQVNLDNNGKLKNLTTVTIQFLKGDYHRFFVGFHGYLRDFILILFGLKDTVR